MYIYDCVIEQRIIFIIGVIFLVKTNKTSKIKISILQ